MQTVTKPKAVRWYWRAAMLGDSQAMYNLGCCYSDGLGVAKDDSKAARWFAEAAVSLKSFKFRLQQTMHP